MTVAYQETREVPLDQLVPFPGNAKRGDIPKLRESLRAGQYRSLVVRAMPDGALMILAGNNTALAMREEGWTAARCEIIVCTDDEGRRINVKDNSLPERGVYDQSALAELMASFAGDYTGIGYDPDQAEKIMASVQSLGESAQAFLASPAAPWTHPQAAPLPAGSPPAPAPANRPRPVEPPAEFPSYDDETIHTDFKCPRCEYEWSGKPRAD